MEVSESELLLVVGGGCVEGGGGVDCSRDGVGREDAVAKCGIDWDGLCPGLLPGWKVWDSAEPVDG